jgi:hypothetical protein
MLRTLFLAAFLFFAVGAVAQSQQPPTKLSQQNAPQQDRGSESSPVVVKVLPAEKSKDDLAREDAQNSEKAAAEGRLINLTSDLAFYTKLLFGATACLALVTVGLVVVGFLQVRDAKESIAATKKAAEAAQESTNLARTEFNASHRPRIILREAIIGSVLEGNPINVTLHIANVGDNAGKIIRSTIAVEIVSAPRLFMNSSVEVKSDLGEINLGPGEAMLVAYSGTTPKWEAEKFKEKSTMTAYGEPRVWRDFSVHLAGVLLYVDQLGIPRRTGFRRELKPERQRFYRIPDEPDLEYAD